MTTSEGSRKDDVTKTKSSSMHPVGLLPWLVSGNWPARLGALLLIGIGAYALLRYLMPTWTYPPSRDIRGEPRPQITSATYASPRNGQSFDVTTRIRTQCQIGIAGCVVVCNNDLAGDPDVGQGKICVIQYRCGGNPPQTLRLAERHPRLVRCD